jgi:hypothetical protein
MEKDRGLLSITIQKLRCIKKEPKGYDLKIIVFENEKISHSAIELMAKFNAVSIYYNFNIDHQNGKHINVVENAKEMYGIGFKIYFKNNSGVWKRLNLDVIYRKISSAVIVRASESFMIIEKKTHVSFFYKTMQPLNYLKLKCNERNMADFLLQKGILIKCGEYIFNIAIRARKEVVDDWK